jgi:hypothetical protein
MEPVASEAHQDGFMITGSFFGLLVSLKCCKELSGGRKFTHLRCICVSDKREPEFLPLHHLRSLRQSQRKSHISHLRFLRLLRCRWTQEDVCRYLRCVEVWRKYLKSQNPSRLEHLSLLLEPLSLNTYHCYLSVDIKYTCVECIMSYGKPTCRTYVRSSCNYQ